MQLTVDQILANSFSEEEAAKLMGISARQLGDRRRAKTNHPPALPFGRKFIYPKPEFMRWRENQLVTQKYGAA